MIVFVRIPKTGSQTLAGIARRNYPPQRIVSLPNMFTDPEGCRSRLEWVAREAQSVDFLAGHIALDQDALLPRQARYFTMLREPIKRAISHYHAYQRRQVRAGRDPGDVTIDGLMAERPLYIPDNMQTRQLSGHASLDDPPFGECSPAMLEGAKRNVEQRLEVVGLTERFDESVVLLGETFGWRNVAYTPMNVFNTPMAEELPLETISRIREENQLDLQLHEFAREHFARLVAAQGSDFELNLEALRRSRELREGTADGQNGDRRALLIDARARRLLADLELAEARESSRRREKTARAKRRRRPA